MRFLCLLFYFIMYDQITSNFFETFRKLADYQGNNINLELIIGKFNTINK